jgi:tRNA threonylcarbamoyladenosine biosynthesis protein TsaE
MIRLPDETATMTYGAQLAGRLAPGDVVALCGPLGAGKTHLVKGLVAGLGCDRDVSSPTFGLVHEYRREAPPIFHFDLYRLESEEELIALGWDDYLDAGGFCLVEWADLFPALMPPHTRWIQLEHTDDGARQLDERVGKS